MVSVTETAEFGSFARAEDTERRAVKSIGDSGAVEGCPGNGLSDREEEEDDESALQVRVRGRGLLVRQTRMDQRLIRHFFQRSCIMAD